MNLILFTASYPCMVAGEQNFLEIEIEYLAQSFDSVVVVPETCQQSHSLHHPKVEVDSSYAASLQRRGILRTLWRSLTSPLFYRGLAEKPSLLFHFSGLKRLFTFVGKAEVTRKWVENWLQQKKMDGSDCVFYTYWFDQAAAGIAGAKKNFPDLRLVSRAHGYDIYEEQYYTPAFWPCRNMVLAAIDFLFPDSRAGLAYLKKKYPRFSPKYEAALLGVRDPGFLSPAPTDGVFRIISCSMIRPEKRLPLILESIRHAAAIRPQQKIEWHHFGNGNTLSALQQTADDTFSSNAKACFHGYSTTAALMDFYQTRPLDVFINLSSTEGTPVSIMEAIGAGLPVIATAVGGNVEIVSAENGLLVGADPTPDEVASALFFLIDRPQDASNKRRGSRQVWQEHYDADRNFLAFAQKLKDIRAG